MNQKSYRSAMDALQPDPYMKARIAANLELNRAPKKRRRPARLLWAAVAAAVLSVSAGAAYVAISWNRQLEAHYNPTEEQKSALESAMSDIGVTAESNGCTVTIDQIMGDNHAMAVALEIQLPEDTDTACTVVDEQTLQTTAAENGEDWSEINWILERDYDYSGGEFQGGVNLYMSSLYPTTADADALQAAMDDPPQIDSSYLSDEGLAAEFYLMDKYNQETGGSSSGSYTLSYDWDAESRTLSLLILSYFDESPAGKDCTLLLDGLYIEDVLAKYCGAESEATQTENLLGGPLLLTFTANYTPCSERYTIYENDEAVGTVELSPILAWFDFAIETDTGSYDNLEDAANASQTQDRFYTYENGGQTVTQTISPQIILADGTVIETEPCGSGITDSNWGCFVPDTLFDLADVANIQAEGYTIQ